MKDIGLYILLFSILLVGAFFYAHFDTNKKSEVKDMKDEDEPLDFNFDEMDK